MQKYENIVQSLIEYPTEEEWFEFKENWFEPHAIGEYISAISNAAALRGKKYGYFVWGIKDVTHQILGTTFNYQRDFKKEPFQHYLARQVTPDIGFSFHEVWMESKRVIVLEIPAAVKTPTSFDGIRYIRIGSSKENVARYPEREAQLFDVLKNGLPSITNTKSEYQELTFTRLFTYYAGRGIALRTETFDQNLGLRTEKGEYNILAQLLSDDCHMPIRVSVFRGENKAAPLFSVKEFGNTCILLALDKILEYGDVINLIQADERGRIVERKEVSLFDQDAYREAMINAFVHNRWIDGNAPMITVYSNRIEILSRGTLAPSQTIEGFYKGESIPVNQKLSDIFLQLHISERSGRGVPKITEVYGRSAIEFRENSIVVNIPFRYIEQDALQKSRAHSVENDTGIQKAPVMRGTKDNDEFLNVPARRIVMEIRNNANVTQPQLAVKLGLGKTTIQKYIAALKRHGYIERVGSNKNGYWKVLK